MNDPHELDYAVQRIRLGHSHFGIASVCLAAVNYLFITAAGFFDITPFESMGNEKETKVATIAAILGVFLAVRALQDPRRKQILAILGLVLNGLAIPAAWLFLPYI
jgi:hypothetical protein